MNFVGLTVNLKGGESKFFVRAWEVSTVQTMMEAGMKAAREARTEVARKEREGGAGANA
jgi:hypothetical protein